MLKKIIIVFSIFFITLFQSACSSNSQSDPEETLKEIITKATSGDPVQMLQAGSLMYNINTRSELVQTQVEHFKEHQEKGEVIKEKVKLLIAENPNLPQTETYKHYVVYLPPEEANKLKSKYAYYRAVKDLSEGVLVGLIQVDEKWYLDLAYENLDDTFKETAPTGIENSKLDWTEIEQEMSMSFDKVPYNN
ncbi:hypothetical protein [Risungbinella massiliensis]|uniref:hypothetical protein n=1 Tax=Risungbinella massiliensis TaxID=1329796 RepID=UPI0005CC8296|nr:hypothetical protein [Risungbinella massiliensis]